MNRVSIAVEPERMSEGLQSPELSVSEGVLIIGMLAGEIPSPYTYTVVGGGEKVVSVDENTFDLLERNFSLSEMEILDLRDDYRRGRNGRCRVNGTLQRLRDAKSDQ